MSRTPFVWWVRAIGWTWNGLCDHPLFVSMTLAGVLGYCVGSCK